MKHKEILKLWKSVSTTAPPTDIFYFANSLECLLLDRFEWDETASEMGEEYALEHRGLRP